MHHLIMCNLISVQAYNNCGMKVQYHLFIETSVGWQPAPDDNVCPLTEQKPAADEAASARVEGSEETTDTTGNNYILLSLTFSNSITRLHITIEMIMNILWFNSSLV